MSKHTPGPWRRDAASGLKCDVRAENGRAVALCWGLSTSRAALNNTANYRAECDANARLIAAAPDLLEALKAVISVADRSTFEFDLAREAIRLAEDGR